MATETESHTGQANSVNIVEYVGNIKVNDSGGLNAAKAEEAMTDDIRNKETLQVMSSGISITNVVEIPENTKLESDSAATLVPAIEADVKEDKDRVDKGNVIELSNGFADSTHAKGQEQKSEATEGSIFPEAAVEEVRCTEETSPLEVSENILEFVSNEAATIDAKAQEVKTTNKNNIEVNIPLESFQGFPEPAAEEELCLLDAAVAEKENTDTLIVDSTSQVEEITENAPETSMTETDEDAQVIDSTAMEEGQKNLTQSCVSATENKATLIAGLSRTLVVTENVLETAVLETPIEVPKAPKESSVSIVMNADTTAEAFEFISKVPDAAKKVEEKKENSTGKLFMLESEGVAEEQKMTTDENVSYDMDQVNNGNTVKLSNGFADNTLAIEHELKSEATGESIFPEAAVEEVKCTEEPSPVEVSENILGFVSNEATSDATALEVKTKNTNNIEESTTLESFQGVPESAAVKEPCLLDAADSEKENADTLLADSSQAEVTEDGPEPSLTETGEDTQVADSTAKEEIQENNPEAFVPTTEKKENQIAESSKTLVVTGNVLETAILEAPVEAPRAQEESSVSVVTNEHTTIEASDFISKVSGNAKMVEEKKENSLGKLFMQENEGAAEELNMITDENTSMVESSRDNVDDTGNEKTRIEAKKTEEDGELSKAEVKSSNQKSNNIFTKMKQSIVKAKKAITGKSPSSKAMEVECRDDMKL